MLVLAFNFMESTGKITKFNLAVLNEEVLDSFPAQASIVAIKDSYNKDVLGAYNMIDANAKGGDEEPGSYEDGMQLTGEDSLISDLSALTTNVSQNQREEVVTYTVQRGDTISGIAAIHGVTANTILWANNLTSSSYIKEGQILKILPVTGVQHIVKKGETISDVAKKYKAKTEDIISYNNLSADGSLQVGENLIVPDGEVPVTYPARTYVKSYSAPNIDVKSFFSFPVKGIRSQGLHGYNGIDIANQCGTPVFAAADGQVVLSRTTQSRARIGASVFGGYGNHVRIKHSNGTETIYAHLKDVMIPYGANVVKGQQVGTMGGGFELVGGKLYRMEGAGRSTGCHLHFEVRGATNPLAKYSRY